ncbi:hypothetical protein ASAP_1009 [Asaia bogorensis]|uniref:Uncharacterized protein n=1 Tax=Asaia bogorensis TaxID=91915 RepID=A0A060QD27_9PROT|nr:hypothetical protein ASAP_1009 [Asaia bogorensis]
MTAICIAAFLSSEKDLTGAGMNMLSVALRNSDASCLDLLA